jgi:hypothetical protein
MVGNRVMWLGRDDLERLREIERGKERGKERDREAKRETERE